MKSKPRDSETTENINTPSTFQYQTWDLDSVFPSREDPFFADHVSRYFYAQRFIQPGDQVLDVACGKGYGSAVLAQRTDARSILGVDLNPSSIEFARRHFSVDRVQFLLEDALKLQATNQRFNLITAFEMIEHLNPPDTDMFITGLSRCLEPGGKILISTPNHDVVEKARVVIPPFHINNLKAGELKVLLKKHFNKVQMLGQFQKRPVLNNLFFYLDIFNQRHRLGLILKKTGPQFSEKFTEPKTSLAPWKVTDPIPEIENYKFSKWAWRQAGLSFAICSDPRIK